MEIQTREIKYFKTKSGKLPFLDWLYSLKDVNVRAAIRVRLTRVSLGNFGDHDSVGEGVWELRFDLGPGYRVYYGHDGNKIVIILCGGVKKAQTKDIKLAKEYWENYKKED